MGVAKTVISVAIIGDAKRLIGAIGKADAATGGLLGSATKAFAAVAVVDKAFDVVKDILEQTDRMGDATSRITSLLGDIDTKKLTDIAGDFSDIGVSAPDFLEIAAGFTEFASASGLIKPDDIATMAGGVVEFAGALGELKNVDPASLGDDISNFIAGTRGAQAAAKELGVPFDKALTPAQRYAELMARLPGLLNDVSGANQGLDDKQGELGAKWETFAADIGPPVEDVLSGILDLFIHIADDIPRTVKGFQDLAGGIVGFVQTVLGPLGNVRDVLEQIIKFSTGASGPTGKLPGVSAPFGGGLTDSGVNAANNRNAVRNGAVSVTGRIGGP